MEIEIMSEEKVYPAIYEDVEGDKYLYLDGENYYCYSRGMWDNSSEEDNHANDKNITQEYLQNTYGEVVSPEHAGFIIELAELHGFKLVFTSAFEVYRSFAFKSNDLYLYNSRLSEINSIPPKLITIPLPPKAEPKIYPQENPTETPKHFDCVCNKCGGKCCTGLCEDFPKVGDEILTASKSKAKVLAKHGGKLWIEYINGGKGLNTINAASIQKQKTPEEELRDDILDCDNFAITEAKANQLANWLTNKGYEIKKKPQ